MYAIRTEQLSRRFGAALAVDSLDLEVRSGEVLAFLGPNGAGKTTTIRMLTALIAPTSGRAVVAGFDVATGGADLRGAVGLLTETPGLYDRLTVEQNLRIFADLYGVSDPTQRIERWLRRVDLWDRRAAIAGSLSKGMRQKVAICRAVLHDPRIVFFDEPTSALDPESSGTVRDLVRELRSEGRTVFLTTHNLEEADRLSDRIAVFATSLRRLDTAENLRRDLFGLQVTIRLRTATAAHEALVCRVPGVKGVVRREERHLDLTVDDPTSVTPNAVRALVEGGADVEAVSDVRATLEEIYLSLVGKRVAA